MFIQATCCKLNTAFFKFEMVKSNSGQVKSGQISFFPEGVVLCYVSYVQSSQDFKYQSEREQNSKKQTNKKK